MLPRLNQIFGETIDLIRDELDVAGRALRRLRQDMALYFIAASRIRRHVTSFMTKHGVPGMSLAIAYKGQLVFSKGYGLADASTKEQVTTDHLFRIASLSKQSPLLRCSNCTSNRLWVWTRRYLVRAGSSAPPTGPRKIPTSTRSQSSTSLNTPVVGPTLQQT